MQVRVAVCVELLWQSEPGEEQVVDQQINQPFTQRPIDLVVIRTIGQSLARVQAVKQRTTTVVLFIPNPCLISRLPKELCLPTSQVVGLVDVRQQPRQDANAIQHLGRDRGERVFVDMAGLQGFQAGDDDVDESLGVLLGAGVGGVGGVCEMAQVVWRPQGKDVFGGFGELVEPRPPRAVCRDVWFAREAEDVLFEG